MFPSASSPLERPSFEVKGERLKKPEGHFVEVKVESVDFGKALSGTNSTNLEKGPV